MPAHTKKRFRAGLDSTGVCQGRHILIALSGGADSVALLRLLCEAKSQYGLSLSACHVNHGIRGEEAQRDEDFCKQLCARLSIPFYCVRIDVPAACQKTGQGLEETARELRYKALKDVALQNGCSLIATAHNADDHLETVLFHLARGSGSRGMMGIAPVRGNIIRPLLDFTKSEILAYLASIDQPYVTDSTNADASYTRNYIRQTILPAMRKLNPEAARASLMMSASLREDDKYITADLPSGLPPLSELAALPRPVLYRVLAREYAAAGGKGAKREHYEQLIHLVQSGKTANMLCLPGGITAKREKARLIFTPTVRARAKNDFSTATVKHPVFRENDNCSSREVQIGVVSYKILKKVYNSDINTAVSSAILSSELYWRYRLPGDVIRFGGMTRQIKKLLWQTGMSADKRDRFPILCDEKGPLWVPGFPVREDLSPTGTDDLFLVYVPWQHNSQETE